MLFPVMVLAAHAAKESLKVCKFKHLGLVVYGSAAVFTFHLYSDIVYLYMEVLLLLLQSLDGFVTEEAIFLAGVNF